MTRLRWLVLLALAAPAAALEEAPPYRNIHHLDAEYALDLRMGEFPADARDAFRSAENAFRISGGSLNIRHLFLLEELKTRFPIVGDRFWLRFRHRRLQRFEVDDHRGELELEWSPARSWFLSLVGEPGFAKSGISIGAAARWGTSEARSLRLSYHWPDFDNNYAYSNGSVNEGFDVFYRRLPQEARVSATWIDEKTSASLEGRLRRGWERLTRNFASGEAAVEKGALAEGLLDLRRRAGPWTLGLEGEAWRERFSREHEPAALPADQARIAERSLGRLTLERAAGDWRFRAAGGAVAARGEAVHEAAPTSDDAHKVLDRIFEGTVFLKRGQGEWEWGYLYNRQRWETRGPSTGGESLSQNRAKIGWRWDFSERAWIKAVGALELDRNQSEAFFSFDGGTILLQAAF